MPNEFTGMAQAEEAAEMRRAGRASGKGGQCRDHRLGARVVVYLKMWTRQVVVPGAAQPAPGIPAISKALAVVGSVAALGSVAGCGPQSSGGPAQTSTVTPVAMRDGTYTGDAVTTQRGDVQVQIDVSTGRITDIRVPV
jgi:hypothetical protein